MSDWRTRTGTKWPIDARETEALVVLQRALPWRWVIAVARALSFIAEHASAWILLSGVCAILDSPRRIEWLAVLVGTVVAHGSASALKFAVRRPRPNDPRVEALGATLSRLSFPSSHTTSTAAFAVGAALVVAPLWPLALVLVLVMGAARMRLGVHYPSDVLAGAVLGATVALAAHWVGTVLI